MRLHFLPTQLLHIGLALAMVVFGALAFNTTAQAQNYRAQIGGPDGRIFPDVALRGSFKVVQYPVVEMDGKNFRLSPGSRVIDINNRIVMPASITGKRYVVNYVSFANGELHTVWLLTPREMKAYRPTANPKWWEALYKSFGNWVDMAKWLGLSQVGL